MVVKKAIFAAFAVCLIFFLSACYFGNGPAAKNIQRIYRAGYFR